MKKEDGNYDTLFIVIICALGFDLISEILRFLNYEIYSYDGSGLVGLDVLG
jgi:hypothetical protein